MPLVSKLWDVYKRESVFHAGWRSFGFLYEHYIRPELPEANVKICRLNGIPVLYPDARKYDSFIGITNYEGPLIRGMKQSIRAGDDVVIVGAGYGVSTIIASQIVGEGGTVSVFEGSKDMVENTRCSLRINSVSDVELNHNIVSEAISLYGASKGGDVISPSELPSSDKLVLDCEGAESDIISNIESLPDSIIVETHGVYGSPPHEVRTILQERGYSIIDDFIMSKERGVSILVAEN